MRSSRPWFVAGALALFPLLLLADLLRPFVFEQDLLLEVNQARGVREPLYDGKDYLLMAAAAAVVVLAAALALARRQALLRRLALVAWAAAVPVVLLESMLQLLDRPYVYRPGLELTFEPNPENLPGVSGKSRFTTNRLGMRGPEWDESAYRILCVGGSTTVSLYLDDEETWPAQLMRMLNERLPGRPWWVGNVGKSGNDTNHHRVLLSELPEASRVQCCLVLCGVNDMDHSLRGSSEARLRIAPSAVFDVGGDRSPLEPALKRAYLYRWLQRLVLRRSGATLDIEDPRGNAYAARRRLRQAASKDYPLPSLEPALLEYERSLKEILAWCRSRGIRCIFMTQPTMWRESMPPDEESLLWSRPVGFTNQAVSAADLARAMAAFNATMKSLCLRESVECIDLAAACPKDSSVFFDDAHFTERGAELVAEAIAEHLVRNASGP